MVSIRHCSSVKDPEAEDNILRVVLREGVNLDLALLFLAMVIDRKVLG